MATKFTKAVAQQAKFKAGLYGSQGRGKTFTALLFAEGLAARENKRIAYIDTERGTDFYSMDIPERTVHPKAFDFDRIVTRSIMETLEAVLELDTNVHGVLVIDSITHLWEAARAAYTGKRMSNGGIPIQAWDAIKRPYKQLMGAFLDGNFHAILCGREGVEMDKDEDGEMEVVGKKMKAEGETAYEPHVLGRMVQQRNADNSCQISVFFEKDRSGILTNKSFVNPTYAIIEPIVRHLSGTQGTVGSVSDSAEKDAAAIERAQEKAAAERQQMFDTIRSAILASKSLDTLRGAWDLTKGKKGKLGDDLYTKLENLKDSQKAELMGAAA